MDLREMRGKGVEWIEPALFVFLYCTSQELTQGREGQPGYSPPPNRNFKNNDSVGTITLSVSCDLSFSRN